MDCGKMRGMVALHAGGDTTGAERIAVEAHLSGCADCAREFEGFRSGRGLLAELREGEAPPGAIESIWSGIAPSVVPAPRPMKLEWTLRMAAVLVIGLAVGYLVTQAGRPAGREGLPQGSPLVNYTHNGGSSTEIGTHPGAAAATRHANPAQPKSYRMFERTAPMTGPHYLPRVEKVVSSDERSF